jgi:hypothetical protein
MSWAVLLKGANTGGKTFRPSQLAKKLPELGLLSLGAAGTFAVRNGRTAEEVRRAVAAALPFEAETIVLPGAEVIALVQADPVGAGPFDAGVRRFATVAAGPIRPQRPLPYVVPPPPDWEVQVLALRGPFALGIRRRLGPKLIYPNDVVEKGFGVTATTRWWETWESLAKALRGLQPSDASPRPRPRDR